MSDPLLEFHGFILRDRQSQCGIIEQIENQIATQYSTSDWVLHVVLAASARQSCAMRVSCCVFSMQSVAVLQKCIYGLPEMHYRVPTVRVRGGSDPLAGGA